MTLYAATIFLSAFLLFLVQPVIARQILPWFGGSAAVWATCLVFFQSALLAGYAYADFVIRRLRPRRQVALHAALLALSLAWLPIAPGLRWKPAGSEDPTLMILGLLAATIGLPYLILSTTSPLLQAWHWQRFRTRAPYRLFALSNFASLLALLAYPVAIEPWIPTRGQTWIWSLLYAAFAVSCAVTGYVSVRGRAGDRPVVGDDAARGRGDAGSPPAAGSRTRRDDAGERVPGLRRLTWVALSATGSCLLLAVTHHITQNVAAVPFLWLLPLTLYLASFVLAFDHPRWYARPVFLAALAALLPAMAAWIDSLDLRIAAPLYAAGLFVGCMFCHGELERAKPAPGHLTTFYLMVSVGGALGSALVGIVAPLTLPGTFELGLVLVLLGAMAVARVWSTHAAVRLVAVGVTAATAVIVWKGIDRFGADTRVMVRNFYGVVRTRDFTDPVPYRAMYHGAIMHGGQLTDPEARRTPSSYFGPGSGYGRLFASLPPGPRRIGVIGLGAGALAVYAGAADALVFYEIDPQVVEVARREFTFLDDMPGRLEIVLGDGRLSLEREAPRGYDVLAIDAFSGDSIPMHLLTREAMQAYLRHLTPGGAIVFQATNRYIDIAPVVQRLAEEAGMRSVMVSDEPADSEGPDYWLSSTDQIIVTRNAALLAAEPIRSAGRPLEPRPGFPAFTDDYTNLLRILK